MCDFGRFGCHVSSGLRKCCLLFQEVTESMNEHPSKLIYRPRALTRDVISDLYPQTDVRKNDPVARNLDSNRRSIRPLSAIISSHSNKTPFSSLPLFNPNRFKPIQSASLDDATPDPSTFKVVASQPAVLPHPRATLIGPTPASSPSPS
ncbi:hypothetical protein GWI33_003091 [Rhynchophorus ferrugineus]|uniref:Uncharacterized protein n=1 Tax=Rhynchophorus ferrugineus TaxID=354439 RepID=A0A834IJN7_RHYFE|nr:hypothetical protein GWI33_003091 [Rhynchophorus ferrugineus]